MDTKKLQKAVGLIVLACARMQKFNPDQKRDEGGQWADEGKGENKGKKKPYEKETNWGVHTVTPGYGKHKGKFIAESRGHGGKQGYFRVFDTEEEAIAHVDRETRPLKQDEPIRF